LAVLIALSPTMRKAPAPAAASSSHKPADPLRGRKLPLLVLSFTAFCFAGYSTYLYVSYKQAVASGVGADAAEDVSSRYNTIAAKFDSSVDSMESFMGLNKMRMKMAQQATGDVCEVSIGTGRNLAYYDWDFKGYNGVGKIGSDKKIKRGKVKSFTAVDKSAEMLEVAHEKFSKEYPGILGVRWVIQDASKPLPGPPVSANETSGSKESKKYDTIVQTMGLCSTPDPVGLLKNLGESVEEGGRILLLEHGKGTWNWVNKILDGLAPRHAAEFGCWWNKDIGKIVEESGLEVIKLERKALHAGTTWWIELTPRKTTNTTQTSDAGNRPEPSGK
jgi:methyltransferase OMS1